MARVTNMDPMVRHRVFTPTRATSLRTLRPVLKEVPKSPLKILRSHEKYCLYQDDGAPEPAALAAEAHGWLCPPGGAPKGFPGERYRIIKTTKLMPIRRRAVTVISLDIRAATGFILASFTEPCSPTMS